MSETGDVPKISDRITSQLKEIGYFRVTERGLNDYEKFCHFKGSEIIPNSVVVDVGSGWNQELSADLENLNKGIKTVNLDASLAIPPEGIEGVIYKKGEKGGGTHDVREEDQRERLLNTRENSVAAVMPEIPLKDGVADLVVDCYGPATYLSDEKWVEYISEVGRVLKRGGEAHMFPIDNFDDFVLSGDKNGSEVSANKRLNLLEKTLKEKGLTLDKYFQEDEEGNSRVGVVIKKEGDNKESKKDQDYKSRLAEYITGYPIEDGQVLLDKMIDDKQLFHKDLDFPPTEEAMDNPVSYREKIIKRAGEEGIKIISFKEVPEWVLEKDPWIKQTRDNASPTAGCFSEELNCIVIGDPKSEETKVLKVIAHELVHAIDYKRMKQEGGQTLPIEMLEYRAYLLADVSERRMRSEGGIKVLGEVFGDSKIAGSSLGYYLGKSIESGECKDFSEFMKKANRGEIKIPWFGSRETKTQNLM